MDYSPWGSKESGTTERLHFIWQKELCMQMGLRNLRWRNDLGSNKDSLLDQTLISLL